MKVIIGGTTYTRLKSLSFPPSADLVGQSVPIDEYTADIITNNTVTIGQRAVLKDDRDQLWADFWIVYAERLDKQTLRVRAQSLLVLLDRETLPAVMYNAELVSDILIDVFGNTGSALGIYEYQLDSSFSESRVTGFCPEQTARERLLWVTFAIGAYVRSSFSDKILILPIDDTETLIPIDKTYWKPQVNYSDYVTAVKAKYYSFTQGTPQTTEKWVKDGNGTTYIVTEQEMSLSNPTAPSAAPSNVITIDGVYLLNSGNVSEILSHLAKIYFKRTSVEMDVINNSEFKPGERVIVYADQFSMAVGYIESADFSFGLQAKARLKLIGAETVEAANLTVSYMYEGTQLDRKVFPFPVGYVYSIQNPYIDETWGGHRIVYRPTTEAVTGTMSAEGATATVQYAVALDLTLSTGVLYVISVDAVTLEDGVAKIS